MIKVDLDTVEISSDDPIKVVMLLNDLANYGRSQGRTNSPSYVRRKARELQRALNLPVDQPTGE